MKAMRVVRILRLVRVVRAALPAQVCTKTVEPGRYRFIFRVCLCLASVFDSLLISGSVCLRRTVCTCISRHM